MFPGRELNRRHKIVLFLTQNDDEPSCPHWGRKLAGNHEGTGERCIAAFGIALVWALAWALLGWTVAGYAIPRGLTGVVLAGAAMLEIVGLRGRPERAE